MKSDFGLSSLYLELCIASFSTWLLGTSLVCACVVLVRKSEQDVTSDICSHRSFKEQREFWNLLKIAIRHALSIQWNAIQ